MLKVGEIEDLKVDPVDTGVDPTAQRCRRLVDRPGGTVAAQLVWYRARSPRPVARHPPRRRQRTPPLPSTTPSSPGQRSIFYQAAMTGSRCSANASTGTNAKSNSDAYYSRQRRCPLRSLATHDDRRAARLDRFRERGRVGDDGSASPSNEYVSPTGRAPQPGDDRELLLEPVEARRRVAGTGCRTRCARPRTSRRRAPARPDRPTSGRLRPP